MGRYGVSVVPIDENIDSFITEKYDTDRFIVLLCFMLCFALKKVYTL